MLSNALNRSLENARSNAVNGAREELQRARQDAQHHKAAASKAVTTDGRCLVYRQSAAIDGVQGKPWHRERTPPHTDSRWRSQRFCGDAGRAFIARSGFNGVYARKGKSRLPIQQLYGPAVPQMLSNGVVKLITDEARATFAQRVDHEIDRVLQKERLADD